MGMLNGLEDQRLFMALMLFVTALFVAAGTAPDQRWRRRLRLLSIVAFGLTLALVLVEIGLSSAGLIR